MCEEHRLSRNSLLLLCCWCWCSSAAEHKYCGPCIAGWYAKTCPSCRVRPCVPASER